MEKWGNERQGTTASAARAWFPLGATDRLFAHQENHVANAADGMQPTCDKTRQNQGQTSNTVTKYLQVQGTFFEAI